MPFKSNQLAIIMKKEFFFFVVLMLPFAVMAQQQEEQLDFIRAGVIAGFNATQIEGDGYQGYNKFGFNGGGTAYVRFHENMSVNFEILYSMKGSKRSFNNRSPQCSYKLALDYIEVPVLFNYHDNKIGIFSAGLSVGNLIRTREFKGGLETTVNEDNPYNSRVLEGVLSVSFMFTDNFGLNLRGTITLTGLGERTISPNDSYDRTCRSHAFGTHSQFSNVLSMRGMWLF